MSLQLRVNMNRVCVSVERLDNAQQQISVMLHSPFIGPLRDEASSWIEKLKILSEMLTLWLGSQSRWLMLVPVFGDEAETLAKVPADHYCVQCFLFFSFTRTLLYSQADVQNILTF